MMKFQLERIALFSDAVFAIAITLMMIEVRPPHLEHGGSFGEDLSALLKMINTFIGTILSFMMIGFFWTRHHKLMKYVKGYDNKLIWLNIVFLLSIAFIPFSTGLVFENAETSALPMVVYNLNYIVATILCFVLFSYALNPKNGLVADDMEENPRNVREGLLFPIFVYTAVIILAFFDPQMAPLGYALFGFMSVIGRKKKPAEEQVQEEPALAVAEEEVAANIGPGTFS